MPVTLANKISEIIHLEWCCSNVQSRFLCYLCVKALQLYVFDDTDPDETTYLGIAKIPLITLAHDKPIHGTFELVKVRCCAVH